MGIARRGVFAACSVTFLCGHQAPVAAFTTAGGVSLPRQQAVEGRSSIQTTCEALSNSLSSASEPRSDGRRRCARQLIHGRINSILLRSVSELSVSILRYVCCKFYWLRTWAVFCCCRVCRGQLQLTPPLQLRIDTSYKYCTDRHTAQAKLTLRHPFWGFGEEGCMTPRNFGCRSSRCL